MTEELNEKLGGNDAWNAELQVNLIRLGALGILSYAVGFFPIQWANAYDVVNSSNLELVFSVYTSIGLITLAYMIYEYIYEYEDTPDTAPYVVRTLMVYFMNIAGAFFTSSLVALFHTLF